MTAAGVEAHAGLDPYAGASAVHALAEAELVTRIAALGSRERGTTVNVGVIRRRVARSGCSGLCSVVAGSCP
ncbi:peptidase dimerization domain-containing protein [Streptomyces caeruleatus]|uniref:Peptidase M20 dimerisation domain-containing protein n=1 Tax=Streptomyces caeruleatus TaxID=661399 RepID=A0A101TH36_9ACTN|nr:peptidase dimerization domain-containing protein [Streptomyces caeruleatus]KUN92270.1 hypothetical protein AQJ67_40980 [Streptomyces caeruleatus]